MSRTDYKRYNEEDARLVMLIELASQTNYTLNDTILQKVCEAFGHDKSRDWIRTQLRKMQDLGAVTLQETGSVLIATITEAGLDHRLLRGVIEGIARPSSRA